MNELKAGTPQNDPRCDHSVAEFRFSPKSSTGGRKDMATCERVVLLVEDDWLLRQSLADELDAADWTVVEAESGETALEILQNSPAINLLITDIRLGGAIDGWDVAEAARRRSDNFPVIYVSASPSLAGRRVADSIFLSKPCVMIDLLAACRALCPAALH